MTPTFTPLADPSGLRVFDPIENAQLELYTPETLTLAEGSPDSFYFPVDSAVSLDASRLDVPRFITVYVRTDGGTMVGESSVGATTRFEDGRYSVDISSGQLKLYLAVDGGFSVESAEDRTSLEFDAGTTLSLGARSLHERPAGTITIRPTVEDAMRAVSLFGSALKTTSCERSFPTLRGHPPLVRLGEEFDAPTGLERPATDVRIEIPPTFRHLFPVSPLAYYLGAEVVPGPTPRLVAGSFERVLQSPDGFEPAVARILEQVFFFDCVTRTEGYYPVPLHERREVADRVDLDFPALYDAPLSTQLAAYLDVPFEVIEDLLPAWKLTADVAPRPEHTAVLPFVTNDFAIVRCPSERPRPLVRSEPRELTSFYRSEAFARSCGELVDDPGAIVKPAETTSLEHTWVGDGYPLGASKATLESFDRRLTRLTRDRPHIAVDIVVNDPAMAAEDVVERYYGARDVFEFDVTVHYELTRAEFADVLDRGTDFLHYIGHVDETGFDCNDGMFDARGETSVNVDAFLLNACRSYEQGEALVRHGALGGIATLARITNEPAVRVGRTLARALNGGFSLQSALVVARNVSPYGNQYITIGDGALQLVKSPGGTPLLARVRELDGGDSFELELHGYPSAHHGMGAMITPQLASSTEKYLNSGHFATFHVDAGELRAFLRLGEVIPVLIDGGLTWSDELLEDGVS